MIGQTAWRLALIVAVLSTIGCDRVTKHAAMTMLAGAPSRSYLADTVRLVYVENSGGFLSLGAGLPSVVRTGLFTAGTGLLLCLLVVLTIRGRWDRLPMLGVALFVAGGASNWIDRVARGSVVDFLNVGVGPLRTGIFNVADVAILAGAAMMAIGQMKSGGASSQTPRVARDGQQSSDASEDVIDLVPYDPTWPQRYQMEADAIRESLGTSLAIGSSSSSLDFRLEHAGSTAVPGLAAKPI